MFRWRHFHFCTNAFSCEGKMQILRIWHQRSEDATGKMWKQKDMQNGYYRSTITLLPSHLFSIEIFYNFMEVMDTLALCRYKYDDHRIRKIIKSNACIAPCLCKLAFSPISALYHHIFALSHLCHCAVISFHFRLCSLTQTFYYMQ